MASSRRRRSERLALYRTRTYRDLLARLSRSLLALRAARGLTQEDAAHLCGLSTRLYVSLEHGDGNATLVTIARVCDGLHVDIAELFAPRK